MSNAIAQVIYRLIEQIDGEKGIKLIPYKIAQQIKIEVLQWIK